jgi:hypothetical protein
VVLETSVIFLVEHFGRTYLFPEQKLDFFTPYMAAFFNKTSPYKITDRIIIKVEHNIIDETLIDKV